MSAVTSGSWVDIVQLLVFVATGFLALRASRLPLPTVRLIGVVGVAVSAAAAGLAVTRPNDAAVAAASLWTGLILLATVAMIVARILSFPTVTGQSIYAAISAYLILGLMFAAFYAAVARLHGGQFFAGGRMGDSKTFQYFSFTTLTTLGYGDFTAAGSGGQAIAVVEALTGQIFLATLVARLVAAFRTPGPPEAPTGDSRGTHDPGPAPGSGPVRPGPRNHIPGSRRPGRMRPGRQPREPASPAARARRRRPPHVPDR
jgi:hypothetical protein